MLEPLNEKPNAEALPTHGSAGNPNYIISHRISLEEALEMYKVWRDKKQNVTKIVIDPGMEKALMEKAL
jgi:hypothetical protein